MKRLRRIWCWLTSHNWRLFFFVAGGSLERTRFCFENAEVECGRCGHRVPSRVEERGDVLLAVPAYWPDGQIVPDWMIDSLR
jgi:hypothetical protein